jgi:hypothetical protein
LGRTLTHIGFEERERHDARSYLHRESGAFLVYPRQPRTDTAQLHHVLEAQATVDGFGLMNAPDFDLLLLRKASTDTNGGTDREKQTVSHPVLERSARLAGMTPEAFLRSVEEKRGVKVNVIEIPKEEKFFLISTTERTFPDDIARPCCNCGKTLLVSSDVPPNAVSICAECVHLQGIFARTATSAAN